MDISVTRNAISYAYDQPLASKRNQCSAGVADTRKDQYTPERKDEQADSLFSKYLNAKKPRDYTSVVDVTYAHGSPGSQLFHDWNEWKQGQQDVAMPDASSSMEEKLAYVRKRYGGASDALSIYDALNTMRDMGVISQTEYLWAQGGPEVRGTKEEMEYLSHHAIPVSTEDDDYWHTPFMTSPLVGFHSLDDIFKWLEDFRKEDHPLFVSSEEAERMGLLNV